jgi:succinate dehydrogenase / fumarate reductase, cytochrome b subunit
MAGASSPEQRPVSPHLSVWRWHVTMAGSILHRVTGIGLYLGAIGLAIWLMAAATGPDMYTPIGVLLSTWFGQIALYLLVAALAFHLANGVRHLVFDFGYGMNPADADSSAWFTILFAIAAPIGLWALVSFGT